MNQKKFEALDSLAQLSQNKGYLLSEDIMNSAEEHNLSIQDVGWLTNTITTRGILVYDEAPLTNIENDPDEYDDYAQTDYEAIFNRVIELSPLLEPFINDVRQIIPPQFREVSRLKYQVIEGNEYARKRMIEMHLRVAVRIALQRAEEYDLDICETVADAYEGLVKAVDKYDPDTSGAFCSYASFWIFQNISRRQGTCRPLIYYPTHRKELFFTMYPILKEHGCIECQDWYGCSKVKNLICEKLECSEAQAVDVINACTPIDSLDLLIGDVDVFEKQEENCKFGPMSLMCLENALDDAEKESLKEDVEKLLGKLKKRERDVICARYGLDDGREKTLEEIGQSYGVTRERIRQIETKAMNKLLYHARKAKLKEYLY